MASPTSPSIYIPAQKRLIFGVESVAAGTAATSTTVEPCNSITTTIQRHMVNINEYMGVAADMVDYLEMNHHAQIAVQVPLRTTGFGALCLGILMGNASEGVAAVAPYLHTFTPSVTTTRMNTLTIWHDTGDTADILQMTYATVESVKLAFNMTGVVMADITLLARFPSTGVAPAIANYIGSTATYPKTRLQGFQTTFNITKGGGTAYYTNKVISGDLSMKRMLEPIFITANGLTDTKQVYDIAAGPIDLSGTIEFLYDGLAAGSVYADYLTLAEQGVSAKQHQLIMTIDTNNAVEVDFWPIKFASFSLNDSGQQVRAATTFQGYNDLASLNVGTGQALTCPAAVKITNPIATKWTT